MFQTTNQSLYNSRIDVLHFQGFKGAQLLVAPGNPLVVPRPWPRPWLCCDERFDDDVLDARHEQAIVHPCGSLSSSEGLGLPQNLRENHDPWENPLVSHQSMDSVSWPLRGNFHGLMATPLSPSKNDPWSMTGTTASFALR